MIRPYIICHMLQSIDGRIDCSMTEKIDYTNNYYDALSELACDATIEGKVTLKMHYADNSPEAMEKLAEILKTPNDGIVAETVYKSKESERWAIGVDTNGELYWGENTEEQFGAPLIMILGESVPKAYLKFLKARNISYIVTGMDYNDEIDLYEAVRVLASEFGIMRLAVVGGGHLNGSFLDLGLIDEISMMYAAGVDAREGFPASFDGRTKDSEPITLQLTNVSKQGNTIWARYIVNQFPPTTLEGLIMHYLKSHDQMTAKEIAKNIGCSTSDVNSLLYGELSSGCFVQRLPPRPGEMAPLWQMPYK